MLYIDDGLRQAAPGSCAAAGHRARGRSRRIFVSEPMIFADMRNDWRIARKEIWAGAGGHSLGERAGRHPHGQRQPLRSCRVRVEHDIGTALRTAHAIESGWVQVNQATGQIMGQSYGGYKQSGIGREFSSKAC